MKKRTTIALSAIVAVVVFVLGGCPATIDLDQQMAAPEVARSAAVVTAAAYSGPAMINEFVANHTGTDTNEYLEVYGAPSTDYSNLTLLEIEGDGTGAGVLDGVFPVGTTNAGGYWFTGFLNNEIENGTISLLLVDGFSGTQGTDLDTDNDGVLDATPWTEIIDSVAVHDGGTSDLTYGSVVLARGYDGDSYTVGGASRYPNGTDTDSPADWLRNDYDGAGLPGFTGSVDDNEAMNTPNEENIPVTGPPPVEATIMEIQGSGLRSPLEGERVHTQGIVTQISGDGRSFWMQDAVGDGDCSTSDGVYVYRGATITPVEVGDLVSVVANVQEYAYYGSPTDQPLTELGSASEVTVLEQAQPIPTAIPLVRLPNRDIPDGIAFWEALEGMLVSVEHGTVVSPTSAYGEFALLARGNARPGSGYNPGKDALVIRSLGGDQVDYNPERIIVDDANLPETLDVEPGDRINALYGVVDYSYSNYKVLPVRVDVTEKMRPELGWAWRYGSPNTISVTTFNVENLFDLVDEPGKDDGSSTPTAAELETKLAKLALAIRQELRLPEIVVVEEVENTAILQILADRVNAVAGTEYVAVSEESSDGRGIEVGFLYDARIVTLVDEYQLSGPDVEAAFGPSSPSPGREPLVGVFSVFGEEITVVGNHLKSKGGDDPLYGTNWPPVRETEIQRKAQARVVRNFVNGLFAEDPRALVVVAGDMNDFQFAEPGEGQDHPLGILEGGAGEVPMTDVIKLFPVLERWTYMYDGNAQALDHLLMSPALFRHFAGKSILHFNASYPYSMGEDPTNAHRSSDHDAVEVRLSFHRSDWGGHRF